MKLAFTMLCGLGALASAAPATAVTPLSGTLSVFTRATLQNGNAVTATDQHDDFAQWNGAPTALGVQTASQAIDGANYVLSYAATRAKWLSADQGSVKFRNYGWQLNVPFVIGIAVLKSPTARPDWSYDFIAARDSILTINYKVTTLGQTFGLEGWQIDCNCQNSGGPSFNAQDPATMGTFTGLLKAGQAYHVTLNNGGDLLVGGFRSYVGFMDGDFNWSIATTAPEPQTWAIMLIGFSAIGFALRARARAASLAA